MVTVSPARTRLVKRPISGRASRGKSIPSGTATNSSADQPYTASARRPTVGGQDDRWRRTHIHLEDTQRNILKKVAEALFILTGEVLRSLEYAYRIHIIGQVG
jgi:hypothetical protein